MKRVKEVRKLALDLQQDLCTMCKRWNGEFTKDDKFICKYNKNNKRGLYNGLVVLHIKDNPKDNNYKCKYFKRNPKYDTCRLVSKNKSRIVNDGQKKIEYRFVYKKGKVKISKKEVK